MTGASQPITHAHDPLSHEAQPRTYTQPRARSPGRALVCIQAVGPPCLASRSEGTLSSTSGSALGGLNTHMNWSTVQWNQLGGAGGGGGRRRRRGRHGGGPEPAQSRAGRARLPAAPGAARTHTHALPPTPTHSCTNTHLSLSLTHTPPHPGVSPHEEDAQGEAVCDQHQGGGVGEAARVDVAHQVVLKDGHPAGKKAGRARKKAMKKAGGAACVRVRRQGTSTWQH